MIVGILVFIFSLPFSAIVFIEYSTPSSLVNRLAALSRTLATASVVFTVIAGIVGGGGFGYSLIEAWQSLESARVIQVYMEITVITLIVDLMLGVFQSFYSSRQPLDVGGR